MDHLESDIVSFMKKRVYDLAGITSSQVKVYYNDQLLKVKDFSSYVDLYLKKDGEENHPKIIEKVKNDRWEVIASISDGDFK